MQAEWAKFIEWVSLDRRCNWQDTQTIVNSEQTGESIAAGPAPLSGGLPSFAVQGGGTNAVRPGERPARQTVLM